MAATNILRHVNHFTCDGVPDSASGFTIFGLKNQDTCYDQIGKKTYRWNNTTWVADDIYGTSTPGKDATVTVGTVQTVTTGPGTQASVTIADSNPSAGAATLNFNFSIPKGDKGDPGTGQGGGSFPFILVMPSGGDDRAALQAAVDQNAIDNRPIYLIGNLKTSGEIIVNKNNYRFTLFGYGAKLTSTNTNSFTFFKRTMPADNSDANIYIVARHIVEGLEIVGSTSQSGFDLGPSYMSSFRNLKFDSLNESIHLRFGLRTQVNNCEAVNCLNPFTADIGNWTGASNSNSQSNDTTFQDCRCYMPNGGGVAFKVFAASGSVVRDCIIEGGSVTNGIEWDTNNSSVVKDGTIENVHFECVNGASNAFIKANLGAGTITINKCFGQYGALFLDAYSSSGLGFIQTSNVPYWVGRSNKFFKTSNITLDFTYNEAFRGINASFWEGTAPGLCTGGGCGYNKYTYKDIPR